MNETANVVNNIPQNNSIGVIIYCLIIVGILYFFMFRPNKKRMMEYQKMIDNLKVGNRVMAGGIYGGIKKINEKRLNIEIAKNVVIEVSKNAVSCVE
ncbi:MAG: preprotein translocase subunit YajC [Alphaproteobacteria bacterium]|nr:preprotein translocase subunit YajC [Alphaproteobacteria bacterium]